MKPVGEQQVKKLLEDISEMKSVINKNKPLIQKILLPSHFRLVSLIWGFGIILYSLGIQYLIHVHGSFHQVPSQIKTGLYISMAVSAVILSVLKQRILVHSLQKEYPRITIFKIWKEFFSYHFRHMYLPIILLTIFLSFIFIQHHQYTYIVPTISIYAGLVFNYFGSITRIKPYLIGGYWYLISGGICIYLNSIPIVISLAVTLGLGSLVFAFVQKKEGK